MSFSVPPALLDYHVEIVRPSLNHTFNLSCPVSSNSYPQPDVLWTVNGRFISTGQTLTVQSVGKLTSITYDCMAYNSYGATNVKSFRLMEEGRDLTPTTSILLSKGIKSTLGFSSSTGLVETSLFLSRDLISLTTLGISVGINFR